MKIRLLTIVTLLVVPMLAWSAGQSEDSAEAESNVLLSQMLVQEWFNDHSEGYEVLAQRFTEETGIGIDWLISPADQYQNLLRVRLAAGEAADIFWAQADPSTITTTINAPRNAIDFSDEEWVDLLHPARLPGLGVDGKIYGQNFYPISTSWPVFYNKTLFEELGIEPPSTYAEFVRVSEVIQSEGIVPVYEFVAAGWHHVLWVMQIGGEYAQRNPSLYDRLNRNEADLTDVDEFVLAISQLQEMVDRGFFGEDYLSNTGDDLREMLANREYAMTLYGPALAAEIREQYPESTDEWGLFVIPLADNSTAQLNPFSPTRFGFVGTPHEEEVREYFRFMAETENLQYFLDTHPFWTSVGINPEYDDAIDQSIHPMEAELRTRFGQDDMNYVVLQSGVKYVNDQWFDIGTDLEAMFYDAMTPTEVVESIEQRRDELAESQEDPNW